MLKKSILVVVLLALAAPCWADLPRGIPKKVIPFGPWTPEYIREHLDQMEQAPFDGVMIGLTDPEGGPHVTTCERVFSNERLDEASLRPSVEALKSISFHNLTDNFLLVYVTPGDIDWFGDCSALTDNAGLLARIARECGLKGIVLDCEPYGFKLWDYRVVAHPEKTFEEYYEQIRLRGEEFARAIWGEYPDLVLFLLFGYTVLDVADPSNYHYGLLPAFYDGLFYASPEGAKIVDGWEMSYAYTKREQFLDAYWWMHQNALSVTRVPDAYLRKVSAGFGVWVNPNEVGDAPYEWNQKDFSKNYRTPEGFRSVMLAALEIADEYVWIFCPGILWWTGENAPRAYVEALWSAKETLRGLAPWHLKQWAAWPLTEEFAESYELISQVPEQWKFRADPYETGAWYLPGVDDSEWLTVSTTDEWHYQLPYPDATGTGWGRVRFDVPAQYEGRRLYLWFGALDEEGDIYLNGEWVGRWTNDSFEAWQTPFPVEITGHVLFDKPNLLAVRAHADSSLGGVFRPVYLYAEK